MNVFLYENGNNKYFYEVFVKEDENGGIDGVRADLVFRTLEPFSTTVIELEKEEVIKILDNKIKKIIEKHFKAHVDYKGKANPNIEGD